MCLDLSSFKNCTHQVLILEVGLNKHTLRVTDILNGLKNLWCERQVET